jgi:phosphoglucosamine mutase
VHQELSKRDWHLGGESSGHILNLQIASTGDGIVSALMVLDVIMETGKSLKELAAEMLLYPQVMINVQHDSPKKLAQNQKLLDAAKKVDEQLGDDGRVLIRPSGTEPKLRVMVEAKVASVAKKHAKELAELTQTL